MFDFLKSLAFHPRCPKCGQRSLKRQRRVGPVPAGHDPLHVYVCSKCGMVVDVPPHILMQLNAGDATGGSGE